MIHRCGPIAVAALGLLAGCCPKDYTITFQVADAINAPGDDSTREPLEVDVVLLTPAENEKMPGIAQGSLRSDEWFRMRHDDDPKLSAIPEGQLLALRPTDDRNRRDRHMGNWLLSRMDRPAEADVKISFTHPDPCAEGAAIAIYGRFNSMTGLAKEPPLLIRPLAGWNENTDLVIDVGRTSMRCTNCP